MFETRTARRELYTSRQHNNENTELSKRELDTQRIGYCRHLPVQIPFFHPRLDVTQVAQSVFVKDDDGGDDGGDGDDDDEADDDGNDDDNDDLFGLNEFYIYRAR